MSARVRKRWFGVLGGTAGLCALIPAAYGEEGAGELAKHAVGGTWLSVSVFCLIAVVAVYLVFKGIRDR